MEEILREIDSNKLSAEALKIHEKENDAFSKATKIQDQLIKLRVEKTDMLVKIFSEHLIKDSKNDMMLYEQSLGMNFISYFSNISL